MSIAARIQVGIKKFPDSYAFRYSDLPISKQEYATAAKALERLTDKGVIKRLSKGIFYKPEQSVFGELPLDEDEVLRSYLYKDGKRVAYVTGVYLYNKMLLTTQVPRVWKIAAFNHRIYANRGMVKAKPVKSYVPVTEANYELLGLLDAMRDWRKIPDLDRVGGVKVLTSQLEDLTAKQRKQLVKYAIAYPPRVAAFLGILFDLAGFSSETQTLEEKLNPLSMYRLGLGFLSQAGRWNIV